MTKTADAGWSRSKWQVNERLDEGFKKTNETFVSVMAGWRDRRGAEEDRRPHHQCGEPSRCSTNSARGAFGEVQLRRWCATRCRPAST